MRSVSKHIEIDPEDFDDDDLIDELEDRGYIVTHSNEDDLFEKDDILSEMIWRYKNGYIEDAMLLLERRFPEMHGITRRIK
jgi:hypothetical protein